MKRDSFRIYPRTDMKNHVHIPGWLSIVSSPGCSLGLVMACVAAGFFLVLKVGFLIHHDPQPEIFANRTFTAVAVLILCAGTMIGMLQAIQSGRDWISRARIREESYQSAAVHTAARRRRVAELAADPARARYAPLVERGETWSNEHIAYYENPRAFATCIHLRPIELAMRESGIDVRLYKNLEVSAQCHIDLALLQQIFHAGPPLHYSEFYMGDPEYHERPAAFLLCAVHNSMIHTVHPDNAGPLFPSHNSPT
jgi:hypothetical protein